jgi:hypothetical protein
LVPDEMTDLFTQMADAVRAVSQTEKEALQALRTAIS